MTLEEYIFGRLPTLPLCPRDSVILEMRVTPAGKALLQCCSCRYRREAQP